MEDIFKQTFDAVIIGEEYKQKIKKNLTEYQSGLAVAKNKNKNKRFHWNLQRIIIASSTAAVLMFCAIFIPLMAMNGGGGGTDMTATYKTQLLAAVSQLKVVDSYVERIETTMNIDGEELLITYTTSYQKSDSSYIADGYMESSNGTSQRYYVVNGYMYMPVIGSQYGGVKIHLEEEFISFVQFFSKNLGYLTPEIINSLDKESNIKMQSDNDKTIYTFKSKEVSETFVRNSDYTVNVNAIQRITKIKEICSIVIDGKTTNAIMTATYDYIGVIIDLPNDLDTYLEYNG